MARFPFALLVIATLFVGAGCGSDSKPVGATVSPSTSPPGAGPTATPVTPAQPPTPTAAPSPTMTPTPPPPTVTSAPPPPTPTTVPALSANARVAGGGEANLFSPSTVSIAAGGTVTWSWQGGFHDVTADNFALKSDVQSTGTASFTFAAAGSYTFHCSIHPDTMQGTIIVR